MLDDPYYHRLDSHDRLDHNYRGSRTEGLNTVEREGEAQSRGSADMSGCLWRRDRYHFKQLKDRLRAVCLQVAIIPAHLMWRRAHGEPDPVPSLEWRLTCRAGSESLSSGHYESNLRKATMVNAVIIGSGG